MQKIKLLIVGLLSLISLITLIDFTLFSSEEKETIITTSTKRQNYYNAGGNSHVAYTLNTNTRSFPISKEFYNTINEGEKISYTLSPIFKEVNSYTSIKSNSEIYTLRWLTGFVFPIITLLIFIISLKTKKSNEIVFFVLSITTIANLVYLLS